MGVGRAGINVTFCRTLAAGVAEMPYGEEGRKKEGVKWEGRGGIAVAAAGLFALALLAACSCIALTFCCWLFSEIGGYGREPVGYRVSRIFFF